ncbi:MAG: DNA polymerase III subunit beta [Flavobacteriaceae bacterium]|jgi:DNA polymerase-3 subunit beta|nr:DNA polymerase III subunit beta [Flavobacteriaceae bacterium]MDG2290494.1 DNA polymerase III subunit beta [Flavobacteriaceae bacterium]
MNFIVSSTQLQRQLQTLSGVLNTSNTLPILDHVLFELAPQQLKITATDLETTISATIQVESTSEGKLAVPARLLLDTVKTFPEQPLTFSQADNNTLEISSEQGKYALAYANADEYPQAAEVVDASSLSIQGDTLATAINNTIFASGNDDLRPVMSGVFFQLSSSGMTFVATDAHKLVKYERTDVVAPETAEFIMPKKPLNLLKSVLVGSEEEVTVNYNNSNVQFSFDDTVVICRLIDGKYPNYEAVIPKENPNVMSINRVQLLNTVKRVSIFSNKTTHQIRLRIAGAELHISAEDIDYSNKAEERLTCSFQGDDMQIGFNARFLTEMLTNLSSDEIQLELSLPNRAGIITPVDGLDEGEQVTMLVMPVMLNN